MIAFPTEAVPDGTIIAPHHLFIGLAIALLAVMVVWDDQPTREPVAVAVGLKVALFGFALTWPVWPVVGAVGTLAGLLVALVAVVVGPFWRGRLPWFNGYRPGARSVVLVGVLVALDDVIEHSFGWPTPLDQLWKLAIAPLLPGSPVPV